MVWPLATLTLTDDPSGVRHLPVASVWQIDNATGMDRVGWPMGVVEGVSVTVPDSPILIEAPAKKESPPAESLNVTMPSPVGVTAIETMSINWLALDVTKNVL